MVAGDSDLESFAAALGRTRAELEQQIEEADDAKAERRKIERKAANATARVLRRAERAEIDAMAEINRERFEASRTLTDSELRQARDRMTLGAQVDQALAEASVLTAVRASGEGGDGRAGRMEGRDPGRIEGALYEAGVLDVGHRYRVILGQLVANLQREVDSVLRRPLTDERRLESSAEKDARLVRDWEGVRSEVVATLDPSFGSSRSIEKMRGRQGRRPIDGTAPRNGVR